MCVFDYILPELLIIQNTRISFNGIITNNVNYVLDYSTTLLTP